jgi:hypothetical protein
MLKAATASIYPNTISSGFFILFGGGPSLFPPQWVDWGHVDLAAFGGTPAAISHHCVVGLNLSYGTNALGTSESMIFNYFDTYTGNCSGLPASQIGLLFTGLPGTFTSWGPGGLNVGTQWLFGTINLENLGGAGVSLCFEQLEGPIGYAYGFSFNANGSYGPILTVSPNTPVDPEDIFEVYDFAGTTCINFVSAFGGAPKTSWWLGVDAHQAFVNITQAGICTNSCGGLLSLSADGCVCDGSTTNLVISQDIPLIDLANGSQMALIATFGGAGTPVFFGSGCSFDLTSGPLAAIIVLGPPVSPVPIAATIPNGIPPLTIGIQIVIKDRDDQFCPPQDTGTSIVSSNVQEINTF